MKRLLICALLLAQLAALPAGAEEPQRKRLGIIERAISWVGVRYRFGGNDEAKGFDCAGFVRRVFSTIGISLPRSAATQYKEGCIVSREDLQPGDLVFFKNTYKRGISHVGIYVGENQFVHAGSKRKRVVVDRLDSPYFLRHYAGARRLVDS